MNKYFVAGFWVLLLWMGCQETTEQGDRQVESFSTDGKIASIIRNPVTAHAPIDTVHVAKISFDETSYLFGEVDEGAVVKHVFRFTNDGKIPLLISDARSTCGCTVPSWPKAPIAPGESGEITVEFNTTNKKLKQEKPVTITANTYPAETKLYLKGFVNPKAQE